METYQRYREAWKKFYELDERFKRLLSKLDFKPGDKVYFWTEEDSKLVDDHHKAEQELYEALIEYGNEIRSKKRLRGV